MFPEYLIDQIGVGKTRVNEQGQERFFPKYPRAMEDFTSRYDKATGIKGNLITTDPAAANPKYSNLLSDEGKLQALVGPDQPQQDKLLAQGVRPELINTDVGAVTASADGARAGSLATAQTRPRLCSTPTRKQVSSSKWTSHRKPAGSTRSLAKAVASWARTSQEVGKNLLA